MVARISSTRELISTGTSVTVDELLTFIGQARGTDRISIHTTKGDRPGRRHLDADHH